MNAKKPVIGLTVTQVLNDNTVSIWKEYMDAIARAGGLPILLPTLADFNDYEGYLDCIDGLFLTGGQDVMPREYGEECLSGFQLGWPMTPQRDAFELAITQKALARNMPVLGVCRGAQVLNVTLGGTLYQDIDTQLTTRTPALKHFQECPYWSVQHKITLDTSSKLCQIMGQSQLWVNSMHHQSVHQLGQGLVAVATAGDGVVEAVESKDHRYAIGVQWHPERMYEKDDAWYALFHSFVIAAQGE